jgi:PPOX class probable F420-dependent enzyme
MRRDLTMDDLGDLAELRLLAVLATYRRDSSVLLSPVWHEWRDGGFHVVTGSRDVKAAHLRRDPRASIVVCEHSPPYRGVELRCRAQLLTAGAAGAVKRMKQDNCSRHPGPGEHRRRGKTGRPGLVLAGFMTHMCVNSTARDAFNLGYRPTIVASATATRELPVPGGVPVPATTLQTATLAGIADLFALVVGKPDDLPA